MDRSRLAFRHANALRYRVFEGAGRMVANALVQTRVDNAVKERAAEVLRGLGLTVSDAVRILLTRVATEGGLPLGFITDPATRDAWFRAKVLEALEDTRPGTGHEEVEALFAKRRASAMSNTKRLYD